MKYADAKRIQDSIVNDGFSLSWWFGTKCNKCCGLYPRLVVDNTYSANCAYVCDVCGKSSKFYYMPHLAEKGWNNNEFLEQQLSLNF